MRQEYWLAKISRNRARDREVERELTSLGWVVLRFWEHEISADPVACAKRVTVVLEERRTETTGSRNWHEEE